MYKVKTIALPDYYTLMDVAYIYTWKRVSIAATLDPEPSTDAPTLFLPSGCADEIFLLCSRGDEGECRVAKRRQLAATVC